jgi:cardiolipin synthase
MHALPAAWDEETLFTTGDEYFAGLLTAIDHARISVEFESYIFEKGVLADRMVQKLIAAAERGIRVRLIIDGWGSPGFAHDYWPALKTAGIRVRFFRVVPWILRRLPGDPEGFWGRLFLRVRRLNRGLHRKFCLIDGSELWVGSFNVSDVHLRETAGEQAWKDIGVRVRGRELSHARRAFQRAYRGWRALNWPARSPKLLLLNDSFLHKRRTRLEHIDRLKAARRKIWLSTPYFVPVGHVYRLLARRAADGLDVRITVPRDSDVWLMKWVSTPLLRGLAGKGVKVFVYEPRFSHQKVFIADDWVCIGSTNINHRSFLHDLEMDVVITREENRKLVIEGYECDQKLSIPFDRSTWANPPAWERFLSKVFDWLKFNYWS